MLFTFHYIYRHLDKTKRLAGEEDMFTNFTRTNEFICEQWVSLLIWNSIAIRSDIFSLKHVNAWPWFSMHVYETSVFHCGMSLWCFLFWWLMMLFSCSGWSVLFKDSFLCLNGNKMRSLVCLQLCCSGNANTLYVQRWLGFFCVCGIGWECIFRIVVDYFLLELDSVCFVMLPHLSVEANLCYP